MSYTLIKDHTKVNFNYGNTGRKYIVIHYTGNTSDTAQANAVYFRDVYRDASAHFFVDESTVYEVVDPDNTAWAVGVDYGGRLFDACKNGNSISIEMCSTDGRISEQTFLNTVALTKKLMKHYSIPASHVVRHYDVCNKLCPGWDGWVGGDISLWTRFKAEISHNYTKVKTSAEAGGYARAEHDPVAGSVQRKLVIPKGKVVQWISDDGYGWSLVRYKGVRVWVVNSRLKKSSLSKYPTVLLPKGSTVFRLNKSKTALEARTVIKKEKRFTVLCTITHGKYKGQLYLRRNGRYYYSPTQSTNFEFK